MRGGGVNLIPIIKIILNNTERTHINMLSILTWEICLCCISDTTLQLQMTDDDGCGDDVSFVVVASCDVCEGEAAEEHCIINR